MSRSGVLFFLGIVTVTLLAATPAGAAGRVPGGGGLLSRPNPEWEIQKRMVAEPVKAPYPMTYSEQVAQSLGVRKDGVSLYESRDNARNSYAPSVSLGGTMLRLRWRQ